MGYTALIENAASAPGSAQLVPADPQAGDSESPQSSGEEGKEDDGAGSEGMAMFSSVYKESKKYLNFAGYE